MSKRVVVAIEVDEHFVRLLNAQVALSPRGLRGLEGSRSDTPSEVLARVALLEARGAFPEQIHAAIPNEWRPHIEVVSDLRRVKEDAT